MEKQDDDRNENVVHFHRPRGDSMKDKDDESDDEFHIDNIQIEEKKVDDPIIIAQNELIEKSKPTNELEKALFAALHRKEAHVTRLAGEIVKLKAFISKRKQTYKRKRKEDGAPTRALSAYNIFIQDRFARLAKDNEKALKSDDADAQMKRVPPANLVASTGNQWKELSSEEKQKYEVR
jgi:HMG-box domain